MSTPDQPEFTASFMDDYFAEADEHIVTAKRDLLVLESTLGGTLPPSVLEELFRGFHSLKGISAMVELREAEALSHQMESCLRAIQQGALILGSAELETLLDAATTLERVIIARRQGEPVPDIEPSLRALHDLTPSTIQERPAARGADGAVVRPAQEDVRPVTAPVWKVTFIPSPQLVARGVKVDTVRSRLLEIGTILAVIPTVLTAGGISFEFHVRTTNDAGLTALAGDGISYEPLSVPDALGEISPEPMADSVPPSHRTWEVGGTTPTNFVRVDLGRLDDLMRLVGDLVVTRARLDDTVQRIERHVPPAEFRLLEEHQSLMERQLRDLREGVMRVRLVSVGEIFKRMPFVVRDLARDTGKRVRLDLVGQNTEIDKLLIERMMDPVLHLVRNAISHGLETPEQRVAAGKAPEGVIRLAASTAGESVILEIGDDGAGIDVKAVLDRAQAARVPAGDAVTDSRALLDILCASGFSTRQEADRASGRGVGMSVVRQTVQELGGTLALETEPGRGTTFTMTLPLTLAITDAIIAHVGDSIFAVPQSSVREVIEVDAASVRAFEGNELVTYRGATLPIARLARLFDIVPSPRPRLHAIVVGAGASAVGLIVDRIAGQREIVVKTMTDALTRVEGISGATELGDGRLVLILDAAALSQSLRGRARLQPDTVVV